MRTEAVHSPETVMTTYQTTTLWQNQDTPSMIHHHHENFSFREDLAVNLDTSTTCCGLPDVEIEPRLNHDRFLPQHLHFIIY
jgi:hypothetical protein